MRVAGLALALALLACGSPRERPQSAVLVSIDTLRADRVGCYGRADAGTPALDRLARSGTRFADASAPSPVTLPSHASLFTGLDPLRHRVRHNGRFALDAKSATLAEGLARAGLRAGAFVGSVVLAERFGLARGFERYTSPPTRSAPAIFYLGQRPAAEVNADALDWIDGLGDAPFFLFVHYMEPHSPFEPPEPERSRFAGDPYQGEVAAADRALGELLEGLEARGRLREALVIAVGDHGESLGDHGELAHGLFLYQSTLRVPLIAAGPGVRAGRVVEEPVGLVDMAPTLLEALGAAPLPSPDGRSLWPALGGEPLPADRRLYAETFLPRYDHGWSELRALRRGPLKYVEAPRPELYSLESDPAEARNLLEAEPDLAGELAGELARRVARHERSGSGPAPAPPTAAERAALDALGYLPGAHTGGGRVDPKDRVREAAALNRAAQLVQQGQHAEAVRLLRELIRRDPQHLEARLRLVTALMLAGRGDAADDEARALADLARGLPDGERLAAGAHHFLAERALAAGRLGEAAEHYERALALPQPPEVYETLAAVYAELGRREAALDVLERLEARGDATPEARALRLRLGAAAASGPGAAAASDPGAAASSGPGAADSSGAGGTR